jgi:hypothetical protein
MPLLIRGLQRFSLLATSPVAKDPKIANKGEGIHDTRQGDTDKHEGHDHRTDNKISKLNVPP